MVQKFNFKINKYEPYELPKGAKLYDELDAQINCADCGKTMTFGEGYTSRCIHTQHGFGYPVCEKCYEKEWDEERKYRK